MPDIREMEMFRDLSIRRKARLRKVTVLTTLNKGDVIYLPGDTDRKVYVISSGRVRIARISDSGKELTLAYYGDGEMFGELILLHDNPRRTMAVAVMKTTLWSIPKEEFMDIASSSPTFALYLSKIIGFRRNELEHRMENIVFLDVPGRLAAQLLRLAGRNKASNHGHIELKISQLELANLIGATRETTSTALNDLKRTGVVDTSHRTIIIRDIKALESMKDGL